ncbi:MAG: hypothetical protein WD492_14115 [Alkalispirochaeta sp.]
MALLFVGGGPSVGPVLAQSLLGDLSFPAPMSREILIQTDDEGALLQRVTADIAGTRWLWRVEGSLLLYEETAVAGGYIEERRTIGSPVNDLTHGAGCEVGPLTLGPIRSRGVYHRLLDPTAGGTDWSALTDANTLRLDRAIDPGRWTGVAVSGTLPVSFFGADIAPGVVWGTDEDVEISMVALPLSWRVASLELSVARGSFSVPDDDSWLYEAPPFRAEGVTQMGSTVTMHPTFADVPLVLMIEGWRQRVAYRPRRHSVQAYGHVSGGVLAITSRVSRTDSGFRALSGGRPRSARYSGVTLSQGRTVRPWVWRASWDRRAGWEDDLTGPIVDSYSGTAGLAWRRGIARLLRIRGTMDSRETYSVDYRTRFTAGPVGLLAYARHVLNHPSREDHFSATVRLSLRAALGRRRRRFSAVVGWSVAEESEHRHQRVSLTTSIPVGSAFRLELSAKFPVDPPPTGQEAEWLLRLRNSGPNRGSGATSQE